MKQHLILLFLSLMLVIGGVAVADFVQADDKAVEQDETNQEEGSVQRDPLVVEVTLQKHYIDGKVVEETHQETIGSMEDFWSYYDEWQLVTQEQGKVVFRKQVSDISPFLKENGYFGLNDDILTIFDGRPGHQQAIQSFYQIDTSELKSYQAQQLQDGIKIDSKEVYQYVLEAYRELAPSQSVSS